MKQYRKDVPLKFGKYKGIELSTIEERDPDYILWLHDNVKMFKNYYTKDDIEYFKKMKEVEKIIIG